MPSSQPVVQDLFFQSDYNRRLILASYWVVILLAVPFWWNATSIQRLTLPAVPGTQSHLQFPVNIHVAANDQSLVNQIQHLVDERISRAPHRWKGLDVQFDNKQPDSGRDYTVQHHEHHVLVQNRELSIPFLGGELSALADTISSLLVPFSAIPSQEHRVTQYSQRYRLAFTLLNEDAASGQAVVGWDIQDVIFHHFSPLFSSLSVLHNFTIESQVQFHGPLAFKPQSLENAYGLTPEDLTVFLNSAEWTLSSSVSNDPVLHFILFIPSTSQRPLRILNMDGTFSSSNAFLLPQWGGIVIYNPPESTSPHLHLSPSDLESAFSTFSNQLLALLGVPQLPFGVRKEPSTSDSPSQLSDWQLDTLLRRRALENAEGAQDTLHSIVKLVNQIENMPVGQDVKGDVQDALNALNKMYTSSSTSLTEAFLHSAEALALSSRAFFNPGMLALLYFPAEHKYAVYTPLFASALIPLIVAVIRELKAWRQQRSRSQVSENVPRGHDTG